MLEHINLAEDRSIDWVDDLRPRQYYQCRVERAGHLIFSQWFWVNEMYQKGRLYNQNCIRQISADPHPSQRTFVRPSVRKIHFQDNQHTSPLRNLRICQTSDPGSLTGKINKEIFLMSRAMRKCVFSHMRTTKAQISLRIRAVWSAPLLFAA